MATPRFEKLGMDEIRNTLGARIYDLSRLSAVYDARSAPILVPDFQTPFSEWNLEVTERLLDRGCELLGPYLKGLPPFNSLDPGVMTGKELLIWLFSIASECRRRIADALYQRLCALYVSTIQVLGCSLHIPAYSSS